MSFCVTIENVGEGTLVTLTGGGSLWFRFGSQLALVATLGGDTLDGAPIVDDG
jgi:hypothetical protein